MLRFSSQALVFLVALLVTANCGKFQPNSQASNKEEDGLEVLRGLESEVTQRGVVGTDAKKDLLNLVNRLCLQNFSNPVCRLGPPIFNLSCPVLPPAMGGPGIRGNDRNCSVGLIYCNYSGPSRGSCTLPDRRWFF